MGRAARLTSPGAVPIPSWTPTQKPAPLRARFFRARQFTPFEERAQGANCKAFFSRARQSRGGMQCACMYLSTYTNINIHGYCRPPPRHGNDSREGRGEVIRPQCPRA
eukprot:8819680-Pyramimonas_sp.AAC.1